MDQLIFYMNSNFILGQYILIVGKFKYFYFPYLVWIRFYYFSASLLDLCITSVHVACDIYLRKLYTLFCGFPKTFLRWITFVNKAITNSWKKLKKINKHNQYSKPRHFKNPGLVLLIFIVCSTVPMQTKEWKLMSSTQRENGIQSIHKLHKITLLKP